MFFVGRPSQSSFMSARGVDWGAIIAWRSEKVNQNATKDRLDHSRIASRLKANAPIYLSTVRQ